MAEHDGREITVVRKKSRRLKEAKKWRHKSQGNDANMTAYDVCEDLEIMTPQAESTRTSEMVTDAYFGDGNVKSFIVW